MILTAKEIKHLAEFAGFKISEEPDELETEISIEPCPGGGILGDTYGFKHYRMVAYFSEYPDEGMHGLGDEWEEGK